MRTRDQAPTPRSVKESTLSQVAFATKCFSRILDIFQTICHSGPGYTEEDQIHELLDHGVVVRVNTFFFSVKSQSAGVHYWKTVRRIVRDKVPNVSFIKLNDLQVEARHLTVVAGVNFPFLTVKALRLETSVACF